MRALAVASVMVLTPAAAVAAWGRRPQPQLHEFRADVDVSAIRQGNSAVIDLQYTFTPSALERRDAVVPALRRFVRHPSAVWARLHRDGSTLEGRTSLNLGGIGYLLGGRVHATGEVGIEHDEIKHDPFEDTSYLAMPATLELGGRPLPLLSVGAFVRYRPILGTTYARVAQNSERTGDEIRFGGTLTFATPEDRIFGTIWAGRQEADWDFTGYLTGPITTRGWVGGARLSFQTSPSMSVWLRAEGHLEDWQNGRVPPVDGNGNYIEFLEDREAEVWGVIADVGFTYWHKGHTAFRVSLGGGFESEAPVRGLRERGMGRIGVGLISRF